MLPGRTRARTAWWITVASLLPFLVSCPAHAIDPSRTMGQYLRQSWSAGQGFPGGTVTALAQSQDGYLWIGTDKGLIRFDGTSFRTIPQASPSGIAIGAVEAMASDGDGYLWIILQNTQAIRYYDGHFEAGHDETGFGITAMSHQHDGSVLLSSLELGTLRYHGNQYEPLILPKAAQEKADELSSRLSSATGVAPHRFAEADSAVLSIAETADRRIWLGTRDKGLLLLEGGKTVASTVPLPGAKVNCLLAAGENELWIGTDKGLVHRNGDKVVEVPVAVRHAAIFSMIRDRDENLWVGSSAGLARLSAAGIAIEAQTPVTALLEDSNGNIWLGSSRGITCLRDSAFISYPVAGLNSESAGPIYVDSAGRVWFAPIEGGVRWMQGSHAGRLSLAHLDQDVVYSIAGHPGELWLGRQQGGLTRITEQGGSPISKSWVAKTYTEADGLAQNSVYTVYQSSDRTVWAGTVSGGVSRFNPSQSPAKFITLTVADGLASNRIHAIEGGPGGTMWFGTAGGLSQWSGSALKNFTTHNGLPADDVICLYRDDAGILWAGTAGGLAFVREGRVFAADGGQEWLRDPIFGLVDDHHGYLWITTAHRVLRVARQPLLDGKPLTQVREYSSGDGLEGTVGVKRSRLVVKDAQGQIWFSLNGVLSQVQPARANREPSPPVVRVDGVSVDGSPVALNGMLKIPSAQRRIAIDFSALNLVGASPLRFRYRMDGFDHAWSDAGETRQAVYTNLGPGLYSFRVSGSNSPGVWNSAELVLPLRIAPAFWQTWWFQLSMLGSLALLIWLVYSLRLHQISRQVELRVEERADERARIARELHDSLLQGFQGLLLHLEVARQMLPARPHETKAALEKVLDQGDQALAEARSAVQNLRRSPHVGEDLVEALAAMGKELSVIGHETTLRVLVEGRPRLLDPILRDEIYRIAREALRNAFSHAQAKNVEAELTFGDEQFLLRVRDDGIGIDPAILRQGKRPGHWGLPGMRERAESVGAVMELWSESGAGTEIQLALPADVVYGASTEDRGWRKRLHSRTPFL